MTTFTERDHEAVEALLLGRKLVKVSDNILRLDDGRELLFEGHDGGCACSAGCYNLTELNGVDNVITNVSFHDSPEGDDLDGEGVYRIFVYAGNRQINLATFEGSDGNGYYGTGYDIIVRDVPA